MDIETYCSIDKGEGALRFFVRYNTDRFGFTPIGEFIDAYLAHCMSTGQALPTRNEIITGLKNLGIECRSVNGGAAFIVEARCRYDAPAAMALSYYDRYGVQPSSYLAAPEDAERVAPGW